MIHRSIAPMLAASRLHSRPAMLAVCLAVAAGTMARADDDTPLVAGEWRVTFDGGSTHVYTIDRHGRMDGTLDGVKVTGQAVRQNDNFTNLTFHGNDHLVRLWQNDGDHLAVGFFDRKADFPAKNATRVGSGVRQKAAPAFWEPEPNARVDNLPGQWTVVYYSPTGSDPREVAFLGMVRIYTFDAGGNVRGREGNQALTGHAERDNDGAMLLTLNERPNEIERLIPNVYGRVDFEHWRARSKFPASLRTDVGVGTPVTGQSPPGVEKLDVLMLDCLRRIGCSGATLAIARGSHLYYSRGYGWSDFEHNVPIAPDTPMCIASCSKPITAAMVRQCLKERNYPLNLTVLPFFRVKPVGEVVDKRVWNITVENLIDHKAGWQGKPEEQAWQAYNGGRFPVVPEDMLPYMAVQRLSFAPGTKWEYDNCGYGVLARMVPALSGQDWYDYLRYHLLRPYGVQELKWVRHGERREGEPTPLWNGLILEDMPVNQGGVSMPALCTFMSHFWIDGKPRDNGHPLWTHTGSWDNSTTATIWRPDGINVAWSFNGRAEGADPGKPLWDDAIQELVDRGHIPRR